MSSLDFFKFQNHYDGNYLNYCTKTREELDTIQAKLSRLEKYDALYQNFEKKAKNHHFCPLCQRKFQDNAIFDQFVKEKILSKLEKLPDKIKKCEAEILRLNTEMERIDLDKSRVEKLKKLLKDGDGIQKKLKELPNKIKEQEQIESMKKTEAEKIN
jgi:vacuolar-type H+-ATPase subunit I/STV1